MPPPIDPIAIPFRTDVADAKRQFDDALVGFERRWDAFVAYCAAHQPTLDAPTGPAATGGTTAGTREVTTFSGQTVRVPNPRPSAATSAPATAADVAQASVAAAATAAAVASRESVARLAQVVPTREPSQRVLPHRADQIREELGLPSTAPRSQPPRAIVPLVRTPALEGIADPRVPRGERVALPSPTGRELPGIGQAAGLPSGLGVTPVAADLAQLGTAARQVTGELSRAAQRLTGGPANVPLPSASRGAAYEPQDVPAELVRGGPVPQVTTATVPSFPRLPSRPLLPRAARQVPTADLGDVFGVELQPGLATASVRPDVQVGVPQAELRAAVARSVGAKAAATSRLPGLDPAADYADRMASGSYLSGYRSGDPEDRRHLASHLRSIPSSAERVRYLGREADDMVDVADFGDGLSTQDRAMHRRLAAALRREAGRDRAAHGANLLEGPTATGGGGPPRRPPAGPAAGAYPDDDGSGTPSRRVTAQRRAPGSPPPEFVGGGRGHDDDGSYRLATTSADQVGPGRSTPGAGRRMFVPVGGERPGFFSRTFPTFASGIPEGGIRQALSGAGLRHAARYAGEYAGPLAVLAGTRAVAETFDKQAAYANAMAGATSASDVAGIQAARPSGGGFAGNLVESGTESLASIPILGAPIALGRSIRDRGGIRGAIPGVFGFQNEGNRFFNRNATQADVTNELAATSNTYANSGLIVSNRTTHYGAQAQMAEARGDFAGQRESIDLSTDSAIFQNKAFTSQQRTQIQGSIDALKDGRDYKDLSKAEKDKVDSMSAQIKLLAQGGGQFEVDQGKLRDLRKAAIDRSEKSSVVGSASRIRASDLTLNDEYGAQVESITGDFDARIEQTGDAGEKKRLGDEKTAALRLAKGQRERSERVAIIGSNANVTSMDQTLGDSFGAQITSLTGSYDARIEAAGGNRSEQDRLRAEQSSARRLAIGQYARGTDYIEQGSRISVMGSEASGLSARHMDEAAALKGIDAQRWGAYLTSRQETDDVKDDGGEGTKRIKASQAKYAAVLDATAAQADGIRADFAAARGSIRSSTISMLQSATGDLFGAAETSTTDRFARLRQSDPANKTLYDEQEEGEHDVNQLNQGRRRFGYQFSNARRDQGTKVAELERQRLGRSATVQSSIDSTVDDILQARADPNLQNDPDLLAETERSIRSSGRAAVRRTTDYVGGGVRFAQSSAYLTGGGYDYTALRDQADADTRGSNFTSAVDAGLAGGNAGPTGKAAQTNQDNIALGKKIEELSKAIKALAAAAQK